MRAHAYVRVSYVSVFVSVNSWQQIVCVFAVIDAPFVY